MKEYDAFFSYATEDEKVATEIVGALKSHGFKVWYAPTDITVGNDIYKSISDGLQNSKSGILLISKAYSAKQWTKHELTVLLKQHIETDKDIFPIWHCITQKDVSMIYPELANIQAIKTEEGMPGLIETLSSKLSKFSPTIGMIPSWEDPVYRFLTRRGELTLHSEEGPATSLWEFLLDVSDEKYPLFLRGKQYSKSDLLFHAAQLLPHIPDIVERWVGKEGKQKIWDMCVAEDMSPDLFG